MTDQPVNLLAFASDLAKFREQLSQATYRGFGYDGEGAPYASAFVALLDALTEGHEPVQAIARAMQVHDEHTRQEEAAAVAARRHRAQAERDRQAEEENTRKVECPHCGAEPQVGCRTTGPAKASLEDSHRARFRLARTLNDGTPSEDER